MGIQHVFEPALRALFFLERWLGRPCRGSRCQVELPKGLYQGLCCEQDQVFEAGRHGEYSKGGCRWGMRGGGMMGSQHSGPEWHRMDMDANANFSLSHRCRQRYIALLAYLPKQLWVVVWGLPGRECNASCSCRLPDRLCTGFDHTVRQFVISTKARRDIAPLA